MSNIGLYRKKKMSKIGRNIHIEKNRVVVACLWDFREF
jgi:hypothetical protein